MFKVALLTLCVVGVALAATPSDIEGAFQKDPMYLKAKNDPYVQHPGAEGRDALDEMHASLKELQSRLDSMSDTITALSDSESITTKVIDSEKDIADENATEENLDNGSQGEHYNPPPLDDNESDKEEDKKESPLASEAEDLMQYAQSFYTHEVPHNLIVTGQFIRKISRWQGVYYHDGRQHGYLSGRTVNFKKQHDNTGLKVTWTDNLRVYVSGHACKWYILFNGSQCPGGRLEYSKYTGGAYYTNTHFPHTLTGTCFGLRRGQWSVRPYVSAWYGGNCWTGWYTAQNLEVEEVY